MNPKTDLSNIEWTIKFESENGHSLLLLYISLSKKNIYEDKDVLFLTNMQYPFIEFLLA